MKLTILSMVSRARVYLALLQLRRLAREAASDNPYTRAMVPRQRSAAHRDLATGLRLMEGYGEGHALRQAAQRVVDLSDLATE